jgi:regulator of sigma E protease
VDWLLVGLAAGFSWIDPASWWAIAQVVIGIGLVIFVHELGHFLVAKACGVKCEKFYVGFDAFDIKIGDRVIIPRSLLKWTWGETTYGIGIVPLGGYVKMLGQDDNPGNIEKESERSRVAGEQQPGGGQVAGPLDRSKIDPRSYLAKSVPQRMAIISAGVIFNLIFGIIFAAIAFKSSVKYQPPIVGESVVGSPAWVAGFPDARVTRVADHDLTKGYVTFSDMVQEVALHGTDGPVEIEFQPLGSTTTQNVTLTAKSGLIPGLDIPMVGLGQPTVIPRLKAGECVVPDQAGAAASPALQAGDELVAINGRPISSMFEFKREMIPLFDQPIEVSVKRAGSAEPLVVKVPVNQARALGFTLKWQPIAAVQERSPAAAAGLRPGDRIVKVNGADPGSLFSFDQRMVQLLREQKKSVSLDIVRANPGQTEPEALNFEVPLRMPERISEPGLIGPLAIDSLGLAIGAETEVASVEPGSEAEKQGLQAGDWLLGGGYEIAPKFAQSDIFTAKSGSFTFGIDRKEWNAGTLQTTLQLAPTGSGFNFRVRKPGGQEQEIKLISFAANNEYRTPRGIMLTPLEETFQTATWSESFSVASSQIWKEGVRILRFLKKLVSGQISATNLGGPGTIATVATSEATEGTSRLLLFLTMLSANLAIVNFLPIPVLDGGHMVFLAYEGIFRRPVTEKVQVVLTYAGLAFILGLMLFVIFLDVSRIKDWFF